MIERAIIIGIIPFCIVMIEGHLLRQYIKENKKNNPEWTFKKEGWDDCCKNYNKKNGKSTKHSKRDTIIP